MSNLASDTFTGSDGAAWSSTWTTGLNPTAGAVTPSIQSNRGRLTTGSAGGYAGGDRIARKVNITAPVDACALFSFQWTAGDECYPRFYIRSTNTALDGQGGYFVELSKGANTYSIGKGTSYSSSSLPTATAADLVAKVWATNTKYWCRFGVVGSTIQVRVWNDGSSEPGTWDKTATDTTHTTAGSGCGVTVGGGALGARTWDIDDFSLDTAFPGAAVGADATNALTLTQTATAAGSRVLDATNALTATQTATVNNARPLDATNALTLAQTAVAANSRPLAGTNALTLAQTADAINNRALVATNALTMAQTAVMDVSSVNVVGLDSLNPLTLAQVSTLLANLALDASNALTVAQVAEMLREQGLTANTNALTLAQTATLLLAEGIAADDNEILLSQTAAALLNLSLVGVNELALDQSADVVWAGMAAAVNAVALAQTATLEVVAASAVVRGGSWESLLAVYALQRQDYESYRHRRPVACPNDGEPLVSGPRGGLHCVADGWVWDGISGY